MWEMLRTMNNAVVNDKLRNIGGPGVIVQDTKIWTNSERVKERIDQELRKGKALILNKRVKWADQKEVKAEEYKLGRAVERPMLEELDERNTLKNTYSQLTRGESQDPHH